MRQAESDLRQAVFSAGDGAPRLYIVIVTCPNCGARFRLGDTAAAAITAGRRMKCPDCQHRWHPGHDEDEELAVASAEVAAGAVIAPPPSAPPPPPILAPAPDPAPAEPAWPGPEAEREDPEPRRWPVFRTMVALVLGAAFAIGAAGLWLGRVDRDTLRRLPAPFDQAASLLPGAGIPLALAFEGHVARLRSGERVLEVVGTISNPGPERVTVPTLRASLAGPGGVARRWTIAPPVASLGPGASAPFTSTVTGVPAAATQLTLATR